MKKRQLFITAGLVGALSWAGVAFAATSLETTGSSVSVTTNGFVKVDVPQTATDATGGVNGGTAPSWSPTPNAAGAVKPGDLYVISPDGTGDTTNVDFVTTLYLSNPGALAKDYNYLNFKVSVYKYTPGVSGAAGSWGSTPVQTSYLTLANGYVTFDLHAPATGEAYGVSIDKESSYYCISTADSSTNALAPNFYITVKPA